MTDYEYLPSEELRDGPIANRKCTDVLFCLIFLLFIIAVFTVGIIGFSHGQPALILYPYDSSGNQCGRPSQSASSYPYLYFPAAEIFQNFSDYRICLKSCPNINSTNVHCYSNGQVYCDDLLPVFYLKNQNRKIEAYKSKGLWERFCVPESNLSFFSKVVDKIYYSGVIAWVSDIIRCWSCILIVLSIACGLSVAYLILLRYCAELIIWASILCTAAMIITFAVYIGLIAEENYSDESEKKTYNALKVTSILMYCSVILFAVIIVFLFRRIHLAIAVVKSGAIFMKDMPMVLMVPLVIYFLSCAFFVYWILALVFIYSSGELDKTSSAIASISWDTQTRNAFFFEFFAIFWVNSFKIALSQFIVAGTVCFWYFSRDSSSVSAVFSVSYYAVRYHLGTLALGSLILSCVKIVKYVLWYIKERVYKPAFEGNPLLEVCCNCLKVCVLFFERFVEFIDKQGYIQTALAGTGFCIGCKNSFCLVAENAARFLALGAIGDIFKIIGKIFITVVTSYTGFLIISFNEPFKSTVQSPIAPTVVFGIVSYIISGIFMSVHEMACDTIIQAFLIDEKIHSTPCFAPEPLKDFIAEHREKDHESCCFGCL